MSNQECNSCISGGVCSGILFFQALDSFCRHERDPEGERKAPGTSPGHWSGGGSTNSEGSRAI
jgi:hypothetical protein